GLTDARIEAPPPCDVAVRCVDDATGAEVTVERVSWVCELPPEVRGWVSQTAAWDASARRWKLAAPLGAIVLNVFDENFAGSQRAELHAGRNDVEFRLAHHCGLALILRDGESVLPWEANVYPELEPAAGQTPRLSITRSDGQIKLLVHEPGLYTLKIPA